MATLLATTALTAPLLITPALAQNLPTGGSVAAGSVAVAQPSATRLNIVQSSQSAVVNWQSFSIGAGSAVNIVQPNASSAILNRVTGDTPSSIAGSLTANGQVYLVNPNGIAITSSGTVNTGGGFVASTLGITDSDFMAGRRRFSGNGSSADVSNAGAIRVGRGGYAALIGGTVSNSGSIDVPLGKVGLGSGEQVTLDFSGDGFLQVAVPTKAGGADALIRNSGRIRADGGSITISAATAREAARDAVNISGLVQARSISGHNGAIVISGGAGGRVAVSGRVSTAARRGTGGKIAVTGRDIALTGARIDASGRSGGGTVNIGGNYQGQGPLQRADSVSIDAATTIRADATQTGRGGNVVVWSDQLTSFAGTITARGGREGGDGGNAEVSGKAVLDYRGFADLSAAKGAFGTLLLDPYNVIISTSVNNTGGSFTANTNDSIINVATLQNQLAGANVGITTGVGGAQAGDITMASPLTWASGTTLTLNAYHSIAVNAPVTITGAGGLDLTTNNGGSGGTLSFAGGLQYTGTPNSGQRLTINGTAYTLLYSMSDLQGINTSAGLSGNYALAQSLDASRTTGFVPIGVGAGGSPFVAGGFAGTFTGLGNTISGLTINAPLRAGLFGYSTGTISDIGLVGGAVTGTITAGALVADQEGGSISRSYATGTVTAPYSPSGGQVGGLVGYLNGGSVTASYTTGAVTGGGNVGGLVGYAGNTLSSSISGSYATGAVTAVAPGTITANVGGLVGYLWGSITSSYATGAVSGDDYVGGLVGNLYSGSISGSHATGSVSGWSYVGGLAGTAGPVNDPHNGGSIDTSYATGAVSGNNDLGGLVGYQNASISTSFATGAVNGQNQAGSDTIGGLVGLSERDISNSYATGPVSGYDLVGGLVGEQLCAGCAITASYATGPVYSGGDPSTWGSLVATPNPSVSNSYYDSNTSTPTYTAAGVAMTTAQLQSGVLPAGFDPAIWGAGVNLYPYLKSFFPTGVQAVSGHAYTDNGVTPLASPLDHVTVVSNGAVIGTASTGANGYYYLLLPANTITSANGVAAYTTVDAASGATNAVAFRSGVPAGVTTGLDILGNMRSVGTNLTTLSQALLQSDSSYLATVAGTPMAGLTFAGLGIAASGDFTIDSALRTSGPVNIVAGGALAIDEAVQASGVANLTAGGALTIAPTGTVAGSQVILATSGAFTTDGAIQATGAANVTASGALTIAPTGTVSGNQVTLATSGAFVNQRGADAINSATRWLVYSNSPTADTFGGLDSGNVAVWSTAANAAVTETGNRYVFAFQPTLTFTSTNATKTYGQGVTVTGNYTVSEGIASSDVAGAYRGNSPTDAFQGTPSLHSDGDPVDAAVTGSPYTIDISAGTVTSLLGYALAFVSSGTLTVNPEPLIVSVNNASKTYDGLAFNGSNGATYSGFVNGDTAGSILGGTLTYGGSAQGAVNAGNYSITAGGLTLSSPNYSLHYTAGTLTVAPAPLFVSVNNAGKTYDGLAFQGGNGVNYFGFVNGETASVLGGTLTYLGTSQNAVNAGFYALTAGGLTSNNYNIVYSTGLLTVAPAPLFVSVNNASKTYDGLAFHGGDGVNYIGLVNGETASVLGGTLTYLGTSQNAVNVGSYTLTAGGLTSNNYNILYTTGALTVTPAALTVTANNADKTYDGHAFSGGNVSYSGFVNGETANVLGGALVYGGSAQGAVNAGSYGITVSGYTSNNYNLRYLPGTLTVAPAALTVTANNAEKTYDGLAYSGGNGVTYTGFVNGDTAAVLGGALAYGGSAQGAILAGSYAITPDGYTSNNYALSYAPGTLTVKPPPVLDPASGVVRDQLSWLAPPSQPGPVLDGQPKLDARGTGLFYADPRSNRICYRDSTCFSTTGQDAAP